LKAALTLDGRIATSSGDSKWITSETARRHARLLRTEHQAILVGIGTAIADDPRLDRRPPVPAAEPLVRVVLDRSLRLPAESRLVRSIAKGPVLVFCARGAAPGRRLQLEAAGVEVEEVRERRGTDRLDLEEALSGLGARGITSLLVEGGGEVHGSFLDLRLADRLVLYQAPTILGGRSARPSIGGEGVISATEAIRLRDVRSTRLGDGWLLEAALEYA
ncbi:MAG: RibD family protein, partial [Vicinamibacteria bacterium]